MSRPRDPRLIALLVFLGTAAFAAPAHAYRTLADVEAVGQPVTWASPPAVGLDPATELSAEACPPRASCLDHWANKLPSLRGRNWRLTATLVERRWATSPVVQIRPVNHIAIGALALIGLAPERHEKSHRSEISISGAWGIRCARSAE